MVARAPADATRSWRSSRSVSGEVLAHHRLPDDRQAGWSSLGESRSDPSGGTSHLDPNGVEASDLDRTFDPREPLALIRPDVAEHREPSLLGADIDRRAVTTATLDNDQSLYGREGVSDRRALPRFRQRWPPCRAIRWIWEANCR